MYKEILTHFMAFATNKNWNYDIKWLRNKWFEVLMIGMILHLSTVKNIHISLQFGSQTKAVATSIVEEKTAKQVALIETQEPTFKLGAWLDRQKRKSPATKKTKKVKVHRAQHFSNLTFILSPTYAKRKGIAADIVAQKKQNCYDYVQKYAAIALAEQREYGILASITLAQGLLESNAGDSRVARESLNHFGIKCRRKCRGCTCRNYYDDDIYDMFRVFTKPEESYREHSILLNSKRYRHLKKMGKDYKKWAHGLKKAGYATDKNYAKKLIKIIEMLRLDKYDR